MREYKYILTYLNQTETLTVNPANWDDIGLTLQRNMTYMSILRSMSASLRFVKNGGGYEFILNAYHSEGIYAKIYVHIKKRNPATNDYDTFYQGLLDMKPNRIIIEHNYITVPIIDNRKLDLFKDRDELEINLLTEKTIGGEDVSPFLNEQSITLTPIDIYATGKMSCEWFSRQTLITGEVTVLSWPLDSELHPMEIIMNEIGDAFSPGTSEIMFTNNLSGDVEVKIIINAAVKGWGEVLNGSSAFAFSITQKLYVGTYYDGGAVHTEENPITHIKTASPYENAEFNFLTGLVETYTMTVPAGGHLAIFSKWIGDGGGLIFDTNVEIHDETSLLLNIEIKTLGEEDTETKCLFVHEAFLRAIQLLTDETNTNKLFYSSLFGRTISDYISYTTDGEYSNDVIFSGRQCRNYPDAALTVKFIDLFNHFKSLYNIGLGFDNENDRFYIEHVEEFYQASYFMFDLGEVKDFSITPLKEGYFNKILGGYDNDGDYEEVQGAYEFAVKREYSTPTPVKEEHNIRAKYRCDSVGIELTRKKQFNESAREDYRDDNSIFTVRTDGSVPILDLNVTGFAGVDKYYNTMLTPRQNAIRHGNMMLSTTYKSDASIKASSTKKLFEMAVNGVDENSDINQAEMSPSLIIPEMYEFESYINTEILNILLENPHGFVRFSNFGTTYEGYIMEIETGDYNKKATYKLIARSVIPIESKVFEDGESMIFEDSEIYIFE